MKILECINTNRGKYLDISLIWSESGSIPYQSISLQLPL